MKNQYENSSSFVEVIPYKLNSQELIIKTSQKVANALRLVAWGLWGLSSLWLGSVPIVGLIWKNADLLNIIEKFPLEGGMFLVSVPIVFWWVWTYMLDRVIANLVWRETIMSKFERWRDYSHPKRLLLTDAYPIASLLPITDKHPNLQYYFSGLVMPPDIVYMQEKISDLLCFYPEEVIKEHIDKIIIHDFNWSPIDNEDENNNSLFKNLPKSIRNTLEEAYAKRDAQSQGSSFGWMASRRAKTIYIAPSLDDSLGDCLHHELLHMMLFHGLIWKFSREWKAEFGEHQLDQTEYVSHSVMGTGINYGVMNTDEDMATIGENLFSLEWWEKLEEAVVLNQQEWNRPWIVRNKIDKMISFYDKQTHWMMDKDYFDAIRRGDIRTWEDAEVYFSAKK